MSRTRSLSPGIGIGALPGLPQLPEDDELALDVLGELYATADGGGIRQATQACTIKIRDASKVLDSKVRHASKVRDAKPAPGKRARRKVDTSEANVI